MDYSPRPIVRPDEVTIARSSGAGPDAEGARSGSNRGWSRRKLLTRGLGLAAVGAAGGSGLAETFASPANAATTAEPGGIAPGVVVLTDAPTITVDASLGNDFRVTIGGNRMIANAANPSDGQKVTFQVTQGAGGPFTLTWGSAYVFSAGLPQPALSTTPGQTDLLAFIYNASLGSWLFVAFVTGFSAISLPSSTTYRLFASTDGPSSPVAYSGPFLAGIVFEVTTGGMWLDGFWWWVCDSGQSTAPQKFALWQVSNNSGVGNLIASATVTSGMLSAGQWNYVPLATPVPLSVGACYVACTGFTGSFPDSNGQFGAGGPYSAGIVNGPLTAFSDQSGSQPAPFSLSQGVFSAAGTDPTEDMPADGSGSSNFWMDVQVDTQAPAGASYRLWPSYPVTASGNVGISNDTREQTFGTEFRLLEACTLDNIWFFSPPGVSVLPTQCAIWDVATQTVVAGTNNTSPAWSGAPGSGWVSCPYSGVTLPAGDYKTTVYSPGGSRFYWEQPGYFAGGGPASANGIVNGPLSAPNVAGASAPGQCTYQVGSFAYPDTYEASGNGETRWVDVEVTPVSS